MKVLYRKRKGGISAPVLAILTFAVLLVVGVAILMYFYVLAPQATKQANLAVIGEPIITNNTDNSKYVLTVTIKNMGTDTVEITKVQIVAGGSTYDNESDGVSPSTIAAGSSETITVSWKASTVGTLNNGQLYTIILQTNYGNFEFQAAYRVGT